MLAWKIPWTEEADGLQSMGSQRVRHNWAHEHFPHVEPTSDQFSSSAVSNSLWLHGLQHARLPCPSPTPGAYLNSYPLSQWCHSTISSSVISFSSLPSIFPNIRSFPKSQFFASGGQNIGTSVLPMNIQDWFPWGMTGLISLQSKGLFKSLFQHHSSKTSILRCSAFFMLQLAHPYMTIGKAIALIMI